MLFLSTNNLGKQYRMLFLEDTFTFVLMKGGLWLWVFASHYGMNRFVAQKVGLVEDRLAASQGLYRHAY